MKKYLRGLFIVLSLFLFTGNVAFADDSNYSISNENQNLIEQAILREEANKDYIDGVIDLYHVAASDTDSTEDFNKFLNKSLIELKNHDELQDSLLLQAEEEAINLIDSEFIGPTEGINQRASILPPANPAYAAAITSYKAGIQLVKSKGHWQTANYMNHAIVPLTEYTYNPNWKPATYYNKNDEWAKIVDGEELATHYYSRMKSEVFSGKNESGSWSGSYTFNSGHLLTALRGVNYTITYKRQANRNYWTQIKITDVYDFKWEENGYDNFAVGFGNNYAYAMQQGRFIKPFKIEIVREIARL